MIPSIVIDKAAHAALAADYPGASGWSGKSAETKDRYRRIARAVLESADPTRELEFGFVGVTCESPDRCCEGGAYPPGGWTPLSDDGREFVYRGTDYSGYWLCPTHADLAPATPRFQPSAAQVDAVRERHQEKRAVRGPEPRTDAPEEGR